MHMGEVGFVSFTILPKPNKSTTLCFKIILLPLVQNSVCKKDPDSGFLDFLINTFRVVNNELIHIFV